MKIQQMAFVLVAIVIFFAMAALIYFSISLSSLRQDVQQQRDNEAREIARGLAGVPELIFTSSDCSQCIDLDKALVLSQSEKYKDFFGLEYLEIELLYPEKPNIECTKTNYPSCGKITLISTDQDISAKSAFVTLARWDPVLNDFRYELGRIQAAAEEVQ